MFTNNNLYISCRECNSMSQLPIELNEETMTEFINSLIAKRTYYGVRTETVLPEKYCIIAWSNGGEKWLNYGGRRHNHNNEVQVDANEVVVPLYRDQIDKVIDRLDDLPLFANSFEAKSRK